MKRLVLTSVLFISCAFNLTAGSGGPDAYGYIWRDDLDPNGPVYNWIDIIGRPGATFVENFSDDNTVGPFNMGFNFHYYWYDVNQFYVGSNGYIGFQNGQLSSPFPFIPSTALPNDFLAAFGADLNFDGAGNPAQCYYWINPAHDTLVVSWLNVGFWDQTVPNYQGNNTFQIILSTVDSSITFQYQTQTGYYVPPAAVYLTSGIENNSGGIGLQVFVNPPIMINNYLNTPYAVKFYFPQTTTFQAPDVAALYNNNPQNSGRFISYQSPSPFSLTGAVKNTGNVPQNSFNVVSRVLDQVGATLVVDNTGSGALAPGATQTFTMNNTFTPPATSTYTMWTRTYLPGDIVPANDSIDLEIVTVDTTTHPIRLSFDDGINDGAGLSWLGGNGGAAMEFTPPFYPCKLTDVHFYCLANPLLVGFYAAIYDDNGPGGGPASKLDSVYVPGSSIFVPGWIDVQLTNPIIINSGKFYVSWNMDGENLTLGQDLTPPFSNNTYEVLGGTFAIYRSREFEDLMINATIDTIDIQTSINDPASGYVGEFYPNPSTQISTLDYNVASSNASVQYALYNEVGKLILKGSFAESNSGINKLQFNVANLASGIYTCTLQTDKLSTTRKLTVIR